VLVLDHNLPEGLSLGAIPEIRAQSEPAYARQSLRAGALGYVLKDAAESMRTVETHRVMARPDGGARPSRE
jgi:DNA-binding NarL/FixJ family response regulator